jgi:succinate dehydrogenase / fumarate reductase, cytochrome b subunit
VLAFIIFHILHYTTRSVFDYSTLTYIEGGKEFLNVYNMMIFGFSNWIVSLFYVVAIGLLSLHLSHAIRSMFQTVGLQNKKWRSVFQKIAKAYGIIIFIGFSSVPLAVLLGILQPQLPPFHKKTQPVVSIEPKQSTLP